MSAVCSFTATLFGFGLLFLWPYLHSMVLSVVVSDGLQERLCMVAEGESSGVEFGLVWSRCAQGTAVVFVFLFIVVVVDLTGLQAPREYRGLEPFCVKRDKLML